MTEPMKLTDLRPDQLDIIDADPRRSLCWSCNVVEKIPIKAFKVCQQCGHVYPHALDLVTAYNQHTPRGARTRTLADITEILFCQECLHDL